MNVRLTNYISCVTCKHEPQPVEFPRCQECNPNNEYANWQPVGAGVDCEECGRFGLKCITCTAAYVEVTLYLLTACGIVLAFYFMLRLLGVFDA